MITTNTEQRRGRSLRARVLSTAVASALVASGLLVGSAATAVAATTTDQPAGPGPIMQPGTSNVTADSLPTVQINGVAWAQAVVGNTVYAGGSFTNARPAGAAAGTQQTPRGNLLSYTLSTGALNTSFAPSLNGQVRAVAASPDGTRIYVGGDFTTADGVTHPHIAAYSTSTGQVVAAFSPKTDTGVRAIVATNDTVYVGGLIASANGQPRSRLAAFKASNGGLLSWAPNADYTVNAMVLAPGGSKLIVGGAFANVNDSPAYGLAAIDAATGALLPWNAGNTVQDAGQKSSITSLSTDGKAIYGSGYVFGAGGNLEGSFSADPTTGDINWIEDCHGDTYSTFAVNDIVYTVSHAHFCSDVGGYQQYNPWQMKHTIAFTANATGVLKHNPYGGYADFGGTPSPSMYNWFPELATGTYTGQNQAAWSVTGNSQYVVEGGEFPTVNGTAQQGLARFAVKSLAPSTQGPQATGSYAAPTLSSPTSGSVKITWQSNWDRDDKTLTYKVVRNSLTGSPIYTTTADSEWWNRPTLTYTDSSVTPGQTYKYRIYASDPSGNTVAGDTATITVPVTGTLGTYGSRIVSDGATSYWRADEATGRVLQDVVGSNDMDTGSGLTRGATGAVADNVATTFNGAVSSAASTRVATPAPNIFSVEAWVKTTSTSGGKILGFGDVPQNDSSSYDRQLYMDNDGKLYFGVCASNSCPVTLQTSGSYNDGQWHQLVGTLSAAGLTFYVDGVRVGNRTDVTNGQGFDGYWRLGGDNLGGWSGSSSNEYFVGSIDEVAVFPTALSRQTVQAEYVASGRAPTVAPAPTDAYGSAVYSDSPDIYWRLDDQSGPTAADTSPNVAPGVYSGGVAYNTPSPVSGSTGSAVTFDGSSGTVASSQQYANPTVYTEEAWFNTVTTRGGRIIGFGDQQSGNSNNYDRHVYMLNNGQLAFGTYTGQANLATSAGSYNDGQWHHVVATQGPDGMTLYVDGLPVATNAQTAAQSYNGYWRVGGDSDWGGDSPYFAGVIDEVAVYSTELSAARVQAHYQASAARLNQRPTASFTSACTGLSCSFDGSASKDPDGSLTSYVWDFGDGSSGSGVSPSHTYGAAGTYSVSLTVTDDKGAKSAAVTHSVTVAAANQAPSAAFSSSVSNLVVAFDGSASADADGSVAGYAWDFGDGSSGSGVSPSHTYGAAGTYSVSLTVTDDKGAKSAAVTHSVTVAAASSVLAGDAFERRISGGWGSADTGGAWTLVGAGSAFSVAGSGNFTVAKPSAGLSAFLNRVSARDVNGMVDIKTKAAPSGTGTYLSLAVRHNGTSDYRLKVRLLPTSVVLSLTRVVGGTETTIKSVTVSRMTYAVGDILRLRFDATGTGTTTLSGKVWKVGATEPSAWQVTATDTEASLQGVGGIGLASYLSSTSTAPDTESFDNLSVTAMAAQ